MTKLFFFLLIFSSLGLAQQYAPTPTQTGNGSGPTRSAVNPSTLPCTVGVSPALIYNNSGTDIIYTAQGTSPCVYSVAPAGAASSVPIGGVTGNAGGDSTNTLTALVNDQLSGVNRYTANLSTSNTAAQNTTAINSAIATAHAAGGGVVMLAAGSFSYSGTISSLTGDVSIQGAGKKSTILNYTGSGHAIDFYTSPFTIVPSGELFGFTLNLTTSATAGVYTGQADSQWIHDIYIEAPQSGMTGDCLDIVENGSNSNSFAERTYLQNVIVGYCGVDVHWLTLNGDTANSFAYGNYTGLHANCDEGQICYLVDSGVYFGNNHFNATCNVTAYNSGTVGGICFKNAGQIHNNGEFDILGEYDSGVGTGTAYALVNTSTGTIDSFSCNISVANSGGVLNQNTGYPVRCGRPQQTFDQGTYTINGYPSQVDVNWLAEDNGNLGAMGGNVGVIHNSNGSVGSAFAGISCLAGNFFGLFDQSTAYGTINNAVLNWNYTCGGNTNQNGSLASFGSGTLSGGPAARMYYYPGTATAYFICYSATGASYCPVSTGNSPLQAPSWIGSGTAPTISVTGAGCTASPTASANSNSLNGSFTMAAGGTCTVTLTWATAFTNNSSCGPLQDITTTALANMASHSASAVTFKSMVIAAGDEIDYNSCQGR